MTTDWDLILDPFYSGKGVTLGVEECQALRAKLREQEAQLQAAEEAIKLAVYFLDEQEALTHMYYRLKGDCEESELDTFNAKDIEWRNALTAFRAAGNNANDNEQGDV